ncbi:MAG: hypothetical protein IJ449_01120 [Clostridia bacterium]|nr:hypothetical protein [Clostridia bacterium]
MKHPSRITALVCLLAAGLLASTSCGSADDTKTDTTGTAGAVDTTPQTEAETMPAFLDSLGDDYDFGGETFNMLIRDTCKPELIVEEAIGEVYNDSVYDRNRKIMERFNVEITYQGLADDGATWHKQISSSVMANDGAYDAVFPDYWWGVETGGYFLNLLDYDEIMDFEQPWWTSGWNDNAEIYGQMYSAVGAMCINIYSNTEAVFFSQSLLNELDLESPYDLVRSRKWTLEKLSELCAEASTDLNGDGVYDMSDDRYGMYYDLQSGRALFPSSGWITSTQQADGGYAYEFWNEDFVQLYDTIYDFLWNNTGVLYSTDASPAYTAFLNNRLLFLSQGLGITTGLRDMDTDYGIVPYPLRDENQEDYVSYNYGTYYIAIPKSASNPEKSAVILEALNAESYYHVKDAYFEINMKEKFSRDEDTQEMLDLIIDNLRFDFTFVNEAATGSIIMYFFDQVAGKNANISSAYEKRQKAFQAQLEKLFETYADTAEQG